MSDDLFDDEYDPLAPMLGGPVADLADDEPLGSGEFAGGGRVVRLVFDEGRLVSVRVHPNWFERLPPEQSLSQAFEEAFLLAALVRADDESTEGDDVDELELDLPPFSEQSVEAYAAMLHDHATRWREVLDTAPAADEPEPATGRQQGVTVTLNRAGHPEKVHFVEEWLDGVQVGVICSSVLTAVNRAYADYSPVVDERQRELERLRREHSVLQAGFRKLVNKVRRGA